MPNIMGQTARPAENRVRVKDLRKMAETDQESVVRNQGSGSDAEKSRHLLPDT
jgi:hypothetical protein